jgi:ABC-type branched-subunit amino acid transport system substrate-binding protein
VAPAGATGEVLRDAPRPERAGLPPIAPVPAKQPSQRTWLLAGGIAAAAIAILALGIAQWNGPSVQPGVSDIRPPAAPPSGRPIRIGLGAALSGPGEPLGKEAALAMKIWREDTNIRGGLLGRPVELVFRDDEGVPFNAPTLFARLIDTDKVDFVVSAGSGLSLTLVMPDLMKSNKLLFALFGMQATRASITPNTSR